MPSQKPTNADNFVNAPFHIDGNCHDPNCPVQEAAPSTGDLHRFEQEALRLVERNRPDVRAVFNTGI